MSRIFTPTVDGWSAEPLDGGRYFMRTAGGAAVEIVLADEDPIAAPAGAALLRVAEVSDGAAPGWAILVGADARLLVNGEPAALGLALLRHRDELRLSGAAPVYFSTERLAVIEECARDDAPRCPRCAQPIVRGELSVRCPACAVLHHQRSDRECWTHLPSCALCDQTTDLKTGLRWTPEEL
jgi:hypothetical protein